ncbi:MAG: DNA cytosine methyltransferase [Caldilineaceae bacterium]|nr:DNA cytosine methyltransferase [Caldilineaceae bacterium]
MSTERLGTVGSQVPVVDLFAGPGGLGEGFSALEGNQFRIAISIEMERTAHKTLLLRSFFRQFPKGCAPSEYYDYVRGDIPITELQAAHPSEWEQATRESWQAELGAEDHAKVRARLDEALGTARDTGEAVLIGGPPCQAYSLAGRSRMKSARGADFESDRRHILYREYLKILADHAPSAFVMENVKGLLSSKHGGKQIFRRILTDLHKPGTALHDYPPRNPSVEYELFPLGTSRQQSLGFFDAIPAESFVLRTEDLGLPQARHRVIIVGVRHDRANRAREVLLPLAGPTERTPLSDVLQELPQLRSGLSRSTDSDCAWMEAVQTSVAHILSITQSFQQPIRDELRRVQANLRTLYNGRGGRFVRTVERSPSYEPTWFVDSKIEGVLNHESKSHMPDDLTRYLFAAVFGQVERRSPTLADFPPELLPKHNNVKRALSGSLFSDRFRVQLADRPSTTITSHISKDGHYYIHHDPCQCRSLTVREAARLQTFPDNYFFEGPRTAQYIQVGNAVPPLLARRIASALASALEL